MISLPQLVFRHVPFQQFSSHPPLSTRSTKGIKTTLDGHRDGRLEHGHLPSPTSFSRWKTENERKGQWRSKAPNAVGTVFHERIYGFQTICHNSQADVATASFLPTIATHVIDAIAIEALHSG